jgi:hypothetical protein
MVALGATSMLVSAGASAAKASEVYPWMSLEAIQEVLDQGGTVVFTEGNYDFENGSVWLGRTGNPVVVRGEKDAEGNHLTQIVNGESTFTVGCEAIPGVFGCGPSMESITGVEIRDLHFRDSRIVSVVAMAFTDLEIVGNRFTGARLVGDPAHPLGMAISIGTWEAWGTGIPKELASGHVLVQDNHIDGLGYATTDPDDDKLGPEPYWQWGRWWSGTSNGIAVASADAHVRILDNEAHDILSTCISTRDVGRTTLISGNRVSADNAWTGCGILVRGLDGVQVIDNECDTIDGGVVLDDVSDAVVHGNTIKLSPRLVWGEQWLGDGINLAWDMGPVTGASVVGNDLTGYTPGPGVAHIRVRLGSSHNQLVNNQYALVDPDNDGPNVIFGEGTADNTLVGGSWQGDLVVEDHSDGANEIVWPSF